MGDRLADARARGEVQHGVDAVDDQQMVDVVDVFEVADDEVVRGDVGAVPGREVVVHGHGVPAGEEPPGGESADVPGSADDEDAHGMGQW